MTNPFEAPELTYYVLTNAEGQHSLWPISAELPGGWTVVAGPAARDEALTLIRTQWTDIRPGSLVAALEASGAE